MPQSEYKPFKWNDKQKEALTYIRDPKYWEIFLWGGARSSKTFLLLAETIYRALKAPGTAHCVCRFEQVDCRKNVFDQTLNAVDAKMYHGRLLTDFAKKFVGVTQLRFVNGSYIAFLGVNGNKNLEKILGSEWSTIFINEASEIEADSYYTLRTRLAEKSDIIPNKLFMDANPPLKCHWLYKRYELKQNLETGKPLVDDCDFFKMKMNPIDNAENISEQVIKNLSSADQPESKRQRFWLGNYVDVLDGAVFKNEIARMDEEGRVLEISIPQKAPVHAVFDIGMTNACWLVHLPADSDKVELVDYIQNYGMGCGFIIDQIIKEKKYNLATVILPHDSKPKVSTTGTSVEEEMRLLGEKNVFDVTTLPSVKWQDSINALRLWIPKMYFNMGACDDGLSALRSYEYAKGSTLGQSTVDNVKPKHNWASHGTDALKYVAFWCGRDITWLRPQKDPRGDPDRIPQGKARNEYLKSWTIEGMMEGYWDDGGSETEYD